MIIFKDKSELEDYASKHPNLQNPLYLREVFICLAYKNELSEDDLKALASTTSAVSFEEQQKALFKTFNIADWSDLLDVKAISQIKVPYDEYYFYRSIVEALFMEKS